MASGFELSADLREEAGKGASRRLRRAGKIPAIMYGGGEPPQSISLDHGDLLLKMEREAFFSSVLTIKVDGAEKQVVVKDVHVHPAKRAVLHLDLQRIIATEKIRIEVPIHLLNEETATGVKLGGGTVAHMMTEVEVSCLPKDLPEYLELDIGELELDDMLYLADVPLPEGVEIPELAQGPENNRPVVSIHIVKVVEEVEEVEGEEGVEGEAVEGEPGAEGEGEGEGEARDADKDKEKGKGDD